MHAGNYSDLPLLDILFGTFHNPREFAAETGFYPGASTRLAEMLRFRDVSELPREARRLTSAGTVRTGTANS
jgi:sterol desaturase/sphingolipid hydroxylase (fatty acid hydroxylase superfamily)